MLEKQWLLECEASDSGMHLDVGKTEVTYPLPAKDYGFSSGSNETIRNNDRQRRAIICVICESSQEKT